MIKVKIMKEEINGCGKDGASPVARHSEPSPWLCVLFGLFGLPAGTIIMDFVTGFVPIIAAWLLCKIFKVKFD